MTIKNYYDILKIERDSNLGVIKKAFRKEVALYHPDNNKTEEAKDQFNDIIEAFDVLSKTEKRNIYNNMLDKQLQNKPVVLEPKQEEQFKDWNKESKQKSKKYQEQTLVEILALDLLLDASVIEGLASGSSDLVDGIGDALGDILDIF